MIRRNIIGGRVRLYRKRANPIITQADLAARVQTEGLRLGRVAISKIETGYRKVTDVEALVIARALGVSVCWLMSENDDTQSG